LAGPESCEKASNFLRGQRLFCQLIKDSRYYKINKIAIITGKTWTLFFAKTGKFSTLFDTHRACGVVSLSKFYAFEVEN
jgi:hypothetical protein